MVAPGENQPRESLALVDFTLLFPFFSKEVWLTGLLDHADVAPVILETTSRAPQASVPAHVGNLFKTFSCIIGEKV